MMATHSFWYRWKTLELAFRLIKRARYSTLSLRPRNTARAWGCASVERLLRRTVAGSGPRTTILAEQVFISRWLSPQTLRAWTPRATANLLAVFRFADRASCEQKISDQTLVFIVSSSESRLHSLCPPRSSSSVR